MCEQGLKDIRENAPASHEQDRTKGKNSYISSSRQMDIELFIDRIFPDHP